MSSSKSSLKTKKDKSDSTSKKRSSSKSVAQKKTASTKKITTKKRASTKKTAKRTIVKKGLPKVKMKFTNRRLSPGLGRAVAKRTYLRTDENGKLEKWSEVAKRVALGNTLLISSQDEEHQKEEYEILRKHLANASLLLSGRHLQHGDKDQPKRNMEVFTNCSTASTSYLLFYLLLNGSGVGRSYDDDLMVVDWDNMPSLRIVLSQDHPDFVWGDDESVSEAKKKYSNAHWFELPDTREGWAQAVEKLEVMAYERRYRDDMLVLDFSKIRPRGSHIKGMQNRPASGPKPLMKAFAKVATIKNAGMKPWMQSIFVDHYLSECVLVGGARRAARIAVKTWTDPGIFDFISIKKGGYLWSANNSVAVDEKFWKQKTQHSRQVLDAILKAQYYDRTGEPGFVNQHKLVQNDEGYQNYTDGEFSNSNKYQPLKNTKKMLSDVAKRASAKYYSQIPNPCGEISLNLLGGYCVIADVVPYFAPTIDDAEEAFRVAVRSLIRVNTMDCLYTREVKRTNRIGVGMTGIHEFAWNQFGYSFRDLVDEGKSKDFWLTLARFKRAVIDEAEKYSKKLGVNVPHTNTTIKPSGTVSKLFALSEGAHLPAMREYMRWVQFKEDDPVVNKYRKRKFPVKELKSYQGTVAVGFPTQPEICRLGMNSRLVTASEATMQEQFTWLMLLEKYWIVGVDEKGKPLADTGNQVSYTLKYDPEQIAFDQYKEVVTEYQSQIKTCSLMPKIDETAYEYQPEESVTSNDFMRVIREINEASNGEEDLLEDINLEHLKCETGACPI
jgi:adenosylcobalamin-dependent ribonucleoside-triphosphate reductase